MSYRYTLNMMINPKTETVVYGAKSVAKNNITMDELAAEIVSDTTLTKADVLAVLRAMSTCALRVFYMGGSVRLSRFANFCPRIKCKTEKKAEDFKPENLEGLKITASPSAETRFQLQKQFVQFERVDNI